MLRDGKGRPSTKYSSVADSALHCVVLLLKTKEIFQMLSAIFIRLLTVLSPSDKYSLFLFIGKCNFVTIKRLL